MRLIIVFWFVIVLLSVVYVWVFYNVDYVIMQQITFNFLVTYVKFFLWNY